MSELALLQLGQVHAHTVDRVVEAAPQERDRSLELVGPDLLDAQLLRQPGVEAVERLVRDRAAHARIDLTIHRLRIDHAVEEPHRRAVDEALELRHVERRASAQLRKDERMRKARGTLERTQRPGKPARPAIGLGDRVGACAVVGRAQRDGA